MANALTKSICLIKLVRLLNVLLGPPVHLLGKSNVSRNPAKVCLLTTPWLGPSSSTVPQGMCNTLAYFLARVLEG